MGCHNPADGCANLTFAGYGDERIHWFFGRQRDVGNPAILDVIRDGGYLAIIQNWRCEVQP